MRAALLITIGLTGCGLVLDDPTPFAVEAEAAPDVAVDADALAPDAQTDGPMERDARPPADSDTPDAAADATPDVTLDGTPADVALDAAPELGPPDAADDAAIDATVDAADAGCQPAPETCNGHDDDCDGETDEDAADVCDPCFGAGVGACARGVRWCVDGVLRCVQAPSPAGGPRACDLVDNDCDGAADEGDEVWPEADPAVVARCAAPPAPEVCDEQADVVGCAPAHACVDPDCRGGCVAAFDAAMLACRGDDPSVACADAAAAARDACVGACEAGLATRWRCAEGPEGPTCAALDCPAELEADGRLCVPRVEVCNNGVDDDGDGLIDGTIGEADPCMVLIDPRGRSHSSGVCELALPGCEDTPRMLDGFAAFFDSVCFGDACPREVTMDYRFALDREEVSIRAYNECVEAGCCLPPSGRTFQLGRQALDAAGPRPDDVDRCAAGVDALDEDARALLPDLPVGGVTWCQARDYCNWVGKRLATDFEWERAAAGVGEERRAYPWGDARPAECPEDQCCAGPEFVGDPPGLCDGGLLVCREDVPAASRLACAANYGFDSQTCTPVLGPAPVYSNADGDSPDGVRNLGGNVAEWVFDWAGEELATISRHNPVGAACDRSFFPGKRHIRGGAFTGVASELRAVERTSMFPQVRAPGLGFRCARTVLDDGGACDPQMPEIPAACRAHADVRVGRGGGPVGPACAAPDFVTADEADRDECPGLLGREGSRECTDGLSDFCASDRQLDCGAFVISRFQLPFGQVPNQSWASIGNTIFDSTLAPRGGPSIFAIDLPAAFDNINREWNGTVGSATVDADGRLAWLGDLDGGLCDQSETLRFPVRTVQGQRAVRPVCNATGRVRLAFRDAPVSILASALGLNATYEPAAELITGTLVFVLTIRDTQDSTFGPTGQSGIGALTNRLGLNPINLCGAAIPFLGAECLAQPLVMPGCAGAVCQNPATCTGYLFPFEFEAVRAVDAGIIGFDGCE